MTVSEHARPRRTAKTVALLLMPASVVAVYSRTIAILWMRWFPAWNQSGSTIYQRIVGGESYYTHGPLTVLVSLVTALLLIRYTRIAVEPRPRLGGFFLLMGLMVHLVASLARVTFVSAFSMVGILAALILMLWGVQALRRLWFALAMLLFAVPLPEVTIAELNFRLKTMAAGWGVGMANAFGIVAVRSGNKVFLEGGNDLVIANVCSGLRTLISLLAFGALYAYVCRLRRWWRLVLFTLALPAAVTSNAVRILSLIVIADRFGVDAAIGWFHGFSGLMIFGLAVAMMFCFERLILLVQRLTGRGGPATPPLHEMRLGQENTGQWHRLGRALQAPAASAATAILLLAAAATWYLNRNPNTSAAVEHLTAILPAQLEIGGHTFRSYEMPLDKQTLAVLETPEYMYRRYVSDGGQPAALDFCLIFTRDNRKGIHPPDLCLEGGGQNIISKADVTVSGVPGRGDVPCRELVVQAGRELRYYLYVYKCAGTYTPSFWRQQLAIFSNGLLSRNSAGALIRISTPITPQQPDRARHGAFALLRQSIPCVDKALP